jgi:hypothetical protein
MRRALVCLTCLALAGCGTAGVTTTVTQTTRAPTSATSPGRTVTPTGKRTRPTRASSGFSPLAAEVVVAFADEYINWNSHTVSSVLQRLAAESIGQAHSAMELAEGETARDYELQRGGIVNSGQIEAVGPLTGSKDEFVVVTRERTTATGTTAYQGLQPAWHVIITRAVELSSGRWVVSLWQPET